MKYKFTIQTLKDRLSYGEAVVKKWEDHEKTLLKRLEELNKVHEEIDELQTHLKHQRADNKNLQHTIQLLKNQEDGLNRELPNHDIETLRNIFSNLIKNHQDEVQSLQVMRDELIEKRAQSEGLNKDEMIAAEEEGADEEVSDEEVDALYNKLKPEENDNEQNSKQ